MIDTDGTAARAEYLARLAQLPDLGAPGFLAQMSAPPHPAAEFAYRAALGRNPNNHDRRHAGATIAMEQEAVAQLAAMLGLPATATGHLTGGGTLANLEGLWHCRQGRGDAPVALGSDAHFVHARNCRLMGVAMRMIPSDAVGRMDLNRLEEVLRRRGAGVVVATLGTPGFGAVDPLHELVALKRRHGFALHVDASYGGFFALLGDALCGNTRAACAALAECDSIAIDPHKLGYQPYGCGCILYPQGPAAACAVDSPYTEPVEDAGIECSRSGAAAGALWLTLRSLPLRSDAGFGPLLRDCLEAAWRFSVQAAEIGLTVPVAPELSVVAFHPRSTTRDAAAVAAASRRLVAAARRRGVELSLLRIAGERIGLAGGDTELVRAVFMKAAQLDYLPALCGILSACAEAAADGASPVSSASSRSRAERVAATS